MSSSKDWKWIQMNLERIGWKWDTWSPGDGITRYRFISPQEQERGISDYFASNGYTALARKEAISYGHGLLDGRRAATASSK